MIVVDALSHTYPGWPVPAVRDVSFEVASAKIFGFLGPNGAGKSTLQNVLIRLLPLQKGAVTYDGESLTTLGRDFFARVGVSFEHPNLYPRLTGRENLLVYAGLYATKTEDPDTMLERVGLGDARDKRAQDYSKGMKQRLVFARALMHRPRFLFLDEPTAGLDPATARVVMAIIKEQRERGATILLTTHDMFVADSLCDQVAFLAGGAIVASDSPRELKLSHGQRAVRVEYRNSGALQTDTLFIDREVDRQRLQELVDEGGVETMHSQEATLEQVFVKLTGRQLTR